MNMSRQVARRSGGSRQTLENWSVLQRMKVPSKLLVFPEENHWILDGENSRFFYEQVWDWIDRWIRPGAPDAVKSTRLP